MAVYTSAGSWEKALDSCRIKRAEEKDGYTVYVIEVHVSPYKWHVYRRYREFVDLHEQMVKNYSLDKNLLPPKKVFGNKSETFISERQKALELYLQTVIHQFSLLPGPLSRFLDFHYYEIRDISATLAEIFFSQGDVIICKEKMYEFHPMHLHAITERLKLGEPTCYSNNPKQDIAHLVEFITQLRHLKIKGSYENFKDSNIIPNYLSYDLSLFKSLDILEIVNCNLDPNLVCVDALRKRLKVMLVHESLKDLATILLSGIIHWSPTNTALQYWPVWEYITHANFSNNFLTKIDTSVKLLISVTHLNFSHNKIQVIENLETLSELSNLNLSYNVIDTLESLHTKLGNIQTLHLSSNKIKSLQGFSKLFSVSKLYLSGNEITSISEVKNLSKLPCLEVLYLKNNPITQNVDYRSQILLMFGSHAASEIELDGLKATEKEIDTVSVLQALKVARGESKYSKPEKSDLELDCSGNSCRDNLPSVKVQGKSPETRALLRKLNNLSDASKFRQQIETLRRIGGSDWLRLLNEMNSSEKGTSKYLSEKCINSQQSSDLQLHAVSAFNKDISQLSSKEIQALAVSSEISYPECISLLDNTSESFKHQFIASLIKYRAYSNSKNESPKDIHSKYSSLLPQGKLIWMVHLISQESTVYEIPICIVLFISEIIILKIKSFPKNIFSDTCCDTSLFPDLSCLKLILPQNIVAITLGPCHAYIDMKVKSNSSHEILTFLSNSKEITECFLKYFHEFYSITPLFKLHPFTNNNIEFEKLHGSLHLSHVSFKNHILFSQRVFVSKLLHKCHYGILHYVFVTPSHIVLVEERLHIPQIVGLDTTVQPQFHICVLVSVHTNIKQIHLKDIDDDYDNTSDRDSLNSSEKQIQPDMLLENKHLDSFYRYGSWLILEFETSVVLYLKFFSLNQRNEFMDAFLCARSQR